MEGMFPLCLVNHASPPVRREAALEAGGTANGQVWCMVLTEDEANAMFVSSYMRGEVGCI